MPLRKTRGADLREWNVDMKLARSWAAPSCGKCRAPASIARAGPVARHTPAVKRRSCRG